MSKFLGYRSIKWYYIRNDERQCVNRHQRRTLPLFLLSYVHSITKWKVIVNGNI